MKICMLLAEPYNHAMPARPAVMEISASLTRMGHEITWVMPSSGDSVESYMGAHIITVPHYTGSLLGAKVWDKFTLALREFRIVDAAIKASGCDIIQARDDIAGGLVAVQLAKKYHIPFVFQYSFPFIEGIRAKHNSLLMRLLATVGEHLLRYIMHHADLVLPVSWWMLEALVAKGIARRKMMYLPLGANVSLFSPNGANNDLAKTKTIIYVGTLDKRRQLDVLIRAMRHVRQSGYMVNLVMVGQGDDRPHLEAMVRNYKLEDTVLFMGQVPYLQVPRFIAAADIGISPVPPTNLYKANSPSKLFEYMSMGKPVVANREIYEHKEALDDSRGGVLVSYGASSFADGIVRLLRNPDIATEMGTRGRAWIIANRSYDVLAQQLEAKYQEVSGCTIR